MEIKTTCPFGNKCEEAKDGAVHRCAWYTELKGTDPQTGEEVSDWKCAIAWMPIVGIEGNKIGMSNVQATEGTRNILSDMSKGV